jgi:hypothetical protein
VSTAAYIASTSARYAACSTSSVPVLGSVSSASASMRVCRNARRTAASWLAGTSASALTSSVRCWSSLSWTSETRPTTRATTQAMETAVRTLARTRSEASQELGERRAREARGMGGPVLFGRGIGPWLSVGTTSS